MGAELEPLGATPLPELRRSAPPLDQLARLIADLPAKDYRRLVRDLEGAPGIPVADALLDWAENRLMTPIKDER